MRHILHEITLQIYLIYLTDNHLSSCDCGASNIFELIEKEMEPLLSTVLLDGQCFSMYIAGLLSFNIIGMT